MKMSFENRILISVTFLITLGFLATSLLSFFVSRQNSIDTLLSSELPLTSDTIYSEVQTDLIGPQIVSSVMSNDTFVRDWIRNGEKDERLIAAYLSEIVKKYDAFTAFLVVDETSNHYVPSGLMRKVSETEPRDEWYFRTKRDTELIQLNVDPAEAENDQLTIFFNVRMLDKNGEFMAVIGLGLNRNLLKSKLEKYRQKYGHRVHFLTKDGRFFLHENPEYEGRYIQDIVPLYGIADEILAIKNGSISYSENGNKILAHARYMKEIDLVLLVEADLGQETKSIYKALIWNLTTCLFVLLIVLVLILKALHRYQNRLQTIANRDDLTGLPNRQAFNQEYERQAQVFLKLSSERLPPTCLLLIDIDHFKRINDQYGHVAGDQVLVQFAKLLKASVPANSFISRWGGEEFVLMLTESSIEEGRKLAEDIRRVIETNDEFIVLMGDHITVSIGVSYCDFEMGIVENFQVADQLMYRAKNEGRNRIMS